MRRSVPGANGPHRARLREPAGGVRRVALSGAGGAARAAGRLRRAGEFRGGLGYRIGIRALETASFLACWGVRGGRAGLPFRVTIDPGGPRERVLSGLCDDEPIAAGELVRIETTGGGGWGDPFARDRSLVELDVLQGKVSLAAARVEYGVVVGDAEATARLRSVPRGERPFFDRGPGYEVLSAGRVGRGPGAG